MASPLVLTVLVFLHILGAALWVGGAAVLVVVNRLLRREVLRDEHRRLLRALGRRATLALVAGFLLAALTGIRLAAARGVGLADLASASFWGTRLGGLLAWKGLAAIVSLGAAVAHGILHARGRWGPVAARGFVSAAAGVALLALGAALRWT